MSPKFADVCVNFLGLIGVALLAWPALYAARLARLAARLRAMRPLDDTRRAKEIHAKVREQVEELRAGWNSGLNFCLLAGTGLTALSYAIGVLKFFFSP